MVGMVAAGWGDKAANLLVSLRGSRDVASKLERLRQLKAILFHRDPSLLLDFVPLLAELRGDQLSPVRRLLAEIFGEIGIKDKGLLPQVIPTLILFLKDETPAVARQAITSGTSLFHRTLKEVALQGLRSSETSNFIESSWMYMLKFKDAVFPMAFQCQSDGVRLLAIKFIESLILLYSSDPSGPSDPPQEDMDEILFNASWLRGGHPVLKVGDLSMVASQSLGLLLDLLRFPQEKPLSNSIIIVLINSLSSIASKRPSFYGRILPVLLRLDPSSSVIKGVEVSGAFHALKNAFSAFLKCAHPGAAPWRSRLVEALKSMDDANHTYQVSHTDTMGKVFVSSDLYNIKGEEPPLQAFTDNSDGHVRKRIKIEIADELSEDNDISNKKTGSMNASDQEICAGTFHEDSNLNVINDGRSSVSQPCPTDGIAGPVQDLVGVFGELVAQGGKAAGSLDVLISHISSDLLAEVVMANMENLPSTLPMSGFEDLSLNKIFPGIIRKDQSFIPSSSFVSDMLSLSSTLSQLNVQQPALDDATACPVKAERSGSMPVDVASSSSTFGASEKTAAAAPVALPSVTNDPEGEKASLFSIHAIDTVTVDDKIPGLGPATKIEDTQGSLDVSQSTNEMQGRSLEQISSESLLHETASSGSMSTYLSDQLSTRASNADISEAPSTSSPYLSSQVFLPKMTAPVIDITDELKDNIQKVAFARIIGDCKQIKVAGGSNVRLSLLACLGAEFPLELDAWALLQKHIYSDYVNNEGQELTLHILYRLFRVSEQDQDFFSASTAAADYEKFLLNVAENLRDLFPASDKSLSTLLCEVPYLPKPVLKLLECLCSPDADEKNDKDMQTNDRVTQGLSTVWRLILLRPSDRDACLQIALKSTVHHLEEVRMKAIRLVANKLFPLTYIAPKIEEYAGQMLCSVVDDLSAREGVGNEMSKVGPQKDPGSEKEGASVPSHEILPEGSVKNTPSASISEAQRCMSLYFALCTKKHSLLKQIFAVYKSMSQAAKEAVHRQIPILVRTTGATSDVLAIISDPPAGSETLLVQVLCTLTDGAIPSQELIDSVKQLYDTKLKDIEILIPILPFLSKDEVLSIFSRLVDLSADRFQVVLSRILQGSPHASPPLTPEEVLIAIHGIDPERDSISLKKILDACTSCFEQRQVFTQQVLAKVLNQLVEQIPLPLLFMRTVIQAVAAFPALVDFVMDILSRLVNKQIWKYPKLWVGFLKCALQTKPHSFNVLLQLPAAQLENALNRNPVLRTPVIEHASQPNIRPTLPRATLAVLGLVLDSQPPVPAPGARSQTGDTTNSAADTGSEVNQGSTVG